MGKGVQASGSYSMLFGFYASAQQNRCIVIGSGVDSQNPMAVTSSGITLGMGSTLPTMYVSEASGAQKTGKVAIGNVTPVAKLHIRSDANEDAGVILEAGDPTGNGAYIQFKDTAHHITVDTGGNMSISAGDYDTLGVTSKNFKLSDCLIDLGVSEEPHLTFSTQGVPSIGCNAYPVTGEYSRNSHGPSYVFEFGSSGLLLRTATYSDPRYNLITNWKNALSVKTDGAVTLNGRVGVNTENSTTDYALAVDGGILTTKVHIQDVNDWPDYVFEDDYQSIPISELKEYIAVYRHLPGVPSEAEVRERGYDVSGMQAVLLEKIEELTLYIEMARACGIRMMDSGMIRCEGVNHFLTYRFDRAGNDKLFSQTLMALYPSADSYESFLYVVRRLGLGYPDVVEAFRRMVFNVMARNVDDHAKNFSFLMNRKGQWSLAPAYDLTFSMDLEALPFENYHAFSVNSKVSDITEEDMIEVAVSFDLKKADARRVIGEVRSSVRKFPEIAQRNGVSRDWIEKVSACLEEPVR